jgi:hypothetical protein
MPNLPAMPANEHAGESTTNIPLIDNPSRGDAFNWWKRLLRLVTPSGDRTAVVTTDRDLQTQPAPLGIPRTLMLSRGLTGPGIDTLPLMGSWAYIPSVDIKRQAGRASIPARTSDDNVTIPAIYAGNPTQGR